MLPYLIAGAIGFVVGKLLEEDEAPKFDDGGSVLLAPNGKPSNLTSEQYKLVRTPEFKAWFGDWENDTENSSKVVDENGEPLVVYHTTDYLDEINVFRFNNDYSFQQWGFGVYFTNDKEHSESYFEGENYIVYEVFLNLKKPIITNQKEKGFNKKYFLEKRESSNESGAIIFHPDRRKWNYYIAGNPNQIKLADGTNTTFDGNNPDIRYAGGGELYSEISKEINEVNALSNKDLTPMQLQYLNKKLLFFPSDKMNTLREINVNLWQELRRKQRNVEDILKNKQNMAK
jgi:hypothetical protein